MQALRKSRYSADEYLAFENASPEKHEYVAGEIFAMVGATRRHNAIALNLAVALKNHLHGTPCAAFIGEIKLRVALANAYYYPDVMVACGEVNAAANDSPVVHDATLVVEVLSPSTEGIDRREKLQAYRLLPGLREYALVAQDRYAVEIHRRDKGDDWQCFLYEPGDKVEFASVGLTLAMDAIYESVGLNPPTDSTAET